MWPAMTPAKIKYRPLSLLRFQLIWLSKFQSKLISHSDITLILDVPIFSMEKNERPKSWNLNSERGLYLQPVVNIVLTNVLPEPKLTKSAAKTEQNKSVAEIHFHSYCNREQPISFRLPNYPLNFFRFLSFTSEKTQIGAFGSGRTLVWTNRKFRNDALVYIVVY